MSLVWLYPIKFSKNLCFDKKNADMERRKKFLVNLKIFIAKLLRT